MSEHVAEHRILAHVACGLIGVSVGLLAATGCSNRADPSDADARARLRAKGERIRVIGERSILELTNARDTDLEYVAQLHGLTDLSISESDPHVTDAGLVHLSSMKSLVHLSLMVPGITDAMVPGITDAGLVHLKGLTDLQSLSLREMQITDDGLKSLKGLRNLRFLNLHGSPITDEGLSHLRGFAQLQRLGLWNTRVSDEGLKHLAALKNLQSLNLWGTKATDAGLGHLRSADLHTLHMSGEHVTDDTMALLKGFPNLKELNLAITKVTDAGVVHLKAMERLRWLTFETTGPTEAAIAELKRALPQLKVRGPQQRAGADAEDAAAQP